MFVSVCVCLWVGVRVYVFVLCVYVFIRVRVCVAKLCVSGGLRVSLCPCTDSLKFLHSVTLEYNT